jgi:glycine betaine/choline ABC-type transport system substrate-binding protein
MQAGQVDLYVEYTGTALNAVLNEKPNGDSSAVYQRVKQLYGQRFNFEVTEPLGFENTFAMVIRDESAQRLHLERMSTSLRLLPGGALALVLNFWNALMVFVDGVSATDYILPSSPVSWISV